MHNDDLAGGPGSVGQTPLDLLGPPNEYPDPASREFVQEVGAGRRIAGTLLIARAGEELGATTTWINSMTAISELAGKRVLISAHRCIESQVGRGIVNDKLLTKRLLEAAGVRVPIGRAAVSPEDAIEFGDEVGVPIVLKPRDASEAHGVSVNLTAPEDIAAAFETARAWGEVVAETYVDAAREFRVFASPTTCHGVVYRVPPWVEGDGVSTVEELIARKNQARDLHPLTVNSPIPIDAQTEAHLRRQELSPASVLPSGRRVVVRPVGTMTEGGEAWECFESAPPQVASAGVAAVAAVPELAWGGVDIMLDSEGVPYVLEVNSNAAIITVEYPFYGQPRPLARVIYESLHSRASEPVLAAPIRIPKHKRPVLVDESDIAAPQGWSLSELLIRDHLERGWNFERFSDGVTRATTDDGSERWLRACATGDDLALVHRLVGQAGQVRAVLRSAGIPRPRGTVTKSIATVKKYLGKRGSQGIVAFPQREPWKKHRPVLSSDAEIDRQLPHLTARHLVQDYPHGLRISVIATQVGPVMVTSHRRASSSALLRATGLAVRAVRAFPGLRWASVDVVFPRSVRGRFRPLVEGLSVNPTFDSTDLVLAGSLAQVWDVILDR